MGQWADERNNIVPQMKRAAVKTNARRSKHVIDETCYMCDGVGTLAEEVKYTCAICGYTSILSTFPTPGACEHVDIDAYSKRRRKCDVCHGTGSLTHF